MSTTTAPRPPAPRPPLRGMSPLGWSIFASRWLQAPLYLGLIVAQAVYVVQFMRELWHLLEGAFSSHALDEADTMLLVLGLVDVVMISNLLIMVIIGGYETFVSRIRLDNHPDHPEWLSHVNANVLKTKLAMSIVGISSIHLLRTFIESNTKRADGTPVITGDVMLWQTVIHLAFVVSALALALIDRMGRDEPHHAPALSPAPAPAVEPAP